MEQGSLIRGQPPIDYTGEQHIRAWYTMGELPVLSWLRLLGGVRTESTTMQTDVKVDTAETDPTSPLHEIWTFRPDTSSGSRTFAFIGKPDSESGSAIDHTDVLPALGMVVKPVSEVQLRLNWSQTMARPTFKEITPVATPIQGTSDVFIGNPDLTMSAMNNYDARLEVFPGTGNVVAVSAFLKRIKNPIDRMLLESSGLSAYMPFNYPEATLKGVEAEVRQKLGAWWRSMDGFSVGANGTLLQSQLTYDQYSVAEFKEFSGNTSRPMTGQPNYIANLNGAYDIPAWGVSLNVFYTFQGRTLVGGESTASDSDGAVYYIPNVYQKPYGTLNASVSKTVWENWKVTLGAKNLLQPRMTQYYDDNGTKLYRTSYGTQIEYSFSLEGKW